MVNMAARLGIPLQDLPAKIAELKFEETPAAADVKQFFDEHKIRLVDGLGLLLRMVPGALPRLLIADKHVEVDGSIRWRFNEVVSGQPDLYPGGLTKLQAVADEKISQCSLQPALAVWVCPWVANDNVPVSLVYVRHCSGEQFLYVSRESQFERMPADEEKVAELVGAVCAIERDLSPYLDEAHTALEQTRDAFSSYLLERQVTELTDEQWDLTLSWLTRREHWEPTLASFALSNVTPAVYESQRLLELLVDTITEVQQKIEADFRQNLERREKDDEKRRKKLGDDLLKLRSLNEGIIARANRTEALNSRLKRQLREAESQQAQASAQSNRLGDALAELFSL